MKRQTKTIRYFIPYCGCIITRNTEPGYALRYTALTPHGRVAADTQAAIRELIRTGK